MPVTPICVRALVERGAATGQGAPERAGRGSDAVMLDGPVLLEARVRSAVRRNRDDHHHAGLRLASGDLQRPREAVGERRGQRHAVLGTAHPAGTWDDPEVLACEVAECEAVWLNPLPSAPTQHFGDDASCEPLLADRHARRHAQATWRCRRVAAHLLLRSACAAEPRLEDGAQRLRAELEVGLAERGVGDASPERHAFRLGLLVEDADDAALLVAQETEDPGLRVMLDAHLRGVVEPCRAREVLLSPEDGVLVIEAGPRPPSGRRPTQTSACPSTNASFVVEVRSTQCLRVASRESAS